MRIGEIVILSKYDIATIKILLSILSILLFYNIILISKQYISSFLS